MKTELQKLHEQLQPFLSSARQIRDMEKLWGTSAGLSHASEMMRQFEPTLRIHEDLRRASASMQAQEMLYGSSLASQSQKLLEQYFPKNLFRANDEISRTYSSAYAFANAAKEHARMLEPIAQQQAFVEKLYRQSFGAGNELAKQIAQSYASITQLREAKKSVDGVLGQFQDIDLSRLKANAKDEHDVEEAVQVITQEAGEQRSFEEAIKGIIAAILSQPNPTVQVMLWMFFSKVIDWLIAGAVGAVMGYYAPNILGSSPQADKKSVQQVARVAVGSAELLAEYRYVSAKVLVARKNANARSPEVGRLVFGNAVKLITKEKNFALVLWTDKKSGAEIQGWVFARHLGKFS